MSFKSLSVAERGEVAQKVRNALNECGLQKINVQTYREEVLAMNSSKEVQGESRITLDPPSQPTTKKDAVEQYNVKLAALEGISDEIKTSLKIACLVGAGDTYVPVEKCTTIDKPDEETSIQHKQGDVMLVDFWATWCPPCQRPMQHNQDMLDKKIPEWEGVVRIIGLSIDGEAGKVVSHVADKKWTSVEHYHRAKSNCSEVYGVKGVPHVLIVDKSGTIVFKGHPAGRPNLEADLTALAKGEVPEGLQVAKPAEGATAGEEDTSDNVPKDSKELDSNAVMAEMDKYHNEIGPKMVAAMADVTVGNMQRCFCVMVAQQNLMGSGKSMGTFQNYRVVVGAHQDVDKVKKVIEDCIPEDMTFTKEEQYHPM